jgi:hypothetical protein
MFGRQIKFVVVGDRPALIQCGRCHLLGHNTRSPLCKTPPHAVKLLQVRRPTPRTTTRLLLQRQTRRRKTLQLQTQVHPMRQRRTSRTVTTMPETRRLPPTNTRNTRDTPSKTGEEDNDDLVPTQREGPPITGRPTPKEDPEEEETTQTKQGNQFEALDADPAQHPNDPRNTQPISCQNLASQAGMMTANDNNFTEIPDIDLESRGPSLEPPAPPVQGGRYAARTRYK